MTKNISQRTVSLFGATLVVVIGLGADMGLRAAENWPDDVPSHRLSDAGSASDSGELPRETTSASYRMSDRGLKSAFPRVPGTLLSELADATLPAADLPRAPETTVPDPIAPEAFGLTAKPRALPPLDAAPETMESPTVAAITQLGSNCLACEACEACGSLDESEFRDPCSACDTCGGGGITCECQQRPGKEGLFQNTLVFLAGDGWKNIFDDDDNNNFGFRTGFNTGFDLPGKRSLRGQIGLSYGAYDFHGRESLLSRDNVVEQQMFGTAGIYKRSMIECGDRLAWGAVYDMMVSEGAGERTDELRLSQLRGYLGYALNERNEIGTWVAFRLMQDFAPEQNVSVRVTDQANLFWHHNWLLGGDTTAYVGWADDPGEVVVGLNGRVPLNQHVALFGNVHYVIPSTTGGDVHPVLRTDDMFTQEAWNISFGIILYRGSKAVSPNVSGVFGLPLLPVADNGTFSFQADML